MRKFFLICSLAVCCNIGFAQSFADYLHARKANHIQQSTSASSLDSLVGTRTLEIQGQLKGTFSTNSMTAVLLEMANGQTVVIEATKVPQWASDGEAQVRAIVTASRSAVNAPLKANLVAIAYEEEVRRLEQKNYKATKTAAKTRAKTSTYVASRGGKAREWYLPPNEATPIYASYIKKCNSRLTNAEASRIAQGIIGFSQHYAVDPRLIVAMVMVESNFDPNSTSRSGAMGLGQLMPGTAKWMGVSNAYDSIDNLAGCVRLVRTHLQEYSHKANNFDDWLALTLAAYNAGDGAVRRHGGVPPYRETQAYIRKVMAIYNTLVGRR